MNEPVVLKQFPGYGSLEGIDADNAGAWIIAGVITIVLFLVVLFVIVKCWQNSEKISEKISDLFSGDWSKL
jgi:hypothetical protein